MKISFAEFCSSRDWLLADGATGTNLFRAGLETGYPPELWNLEHPDRITALHTAFTEAGADILLTNSFGGTAHRLKLHEAVSRVTELNEAAASLARGVADAADRPVLVAGSMGPTGELFEPLGALTPEDAEQAFAEQALALAAGGADMLWIETMSALEEIEAAVKGARQTGLPVAATMTFDTAGRTMMGITPASYAECADRLGLDAFGANCGIGPAELLDSVHGFAEHGSALPMIAKGNCGIPAYVDGEIHYHGTPELMADYAVLARDSGVKIIGGCCGTTPDHVRAMLTALKTTPPQGPTTRQDVTDKLGEAWHNLPEKPSSEQSERRRRRRRG